MLGIHQPWHLLYSAGMILLIIGMFYRNKKKPWLTKIDKLVYAFVGLSIAFEHLSAAFDYAGHESARTRGIELPLDLAGTTAFIYALYYVIRERNKKQRSL